MALSQEYLRLCAEQEIILEVEAGGGGRRGGTVRREVTTPPKEKLYTTPEDMVAVYEALHDIGPFTFAATFGNVHGHYKPGAVKLKPMILKRRDRRRLRRSTAPGRRWIWSSTAEAGAFWRRSGRTLGYGVVKMNVDTDTQYAFTRPIVHHMLANYDGVLKIDGEIGNKKLYDPRSYLKKAEEGMSERVKVACSDLLSEGKSLFRADLAVYSWPKKSGFTRILRHRAGPFWAGPMSRSLSE